MKIAKNKSLVKTRTHVQWAEEISATYQLGVAAFNQGIGHFLEVGRKLVAAKKDLVERVGHGEWLKTIDNLSFSAQTAQKLMRIATDPRLRKAAHVRFLPPSWGTLHELSKLSDAEFAEAVASGAINSTMTRKEARKISVKTSRYTRKIKASYKRGSSSAVPLASPAPASSTKPTAKTKSKSVNVSYTAGKLRQLRDLVAALAIDVAREKTNLPGSFSDDIKALVNDLLALLISDSANTNTESADDRKPVLH